MPVLGRGQVSRAARLDAHPTAEMLLEATLAETGARLHFGLHHETSLQFDEAEREGNCIEYAQLFATLFDRAARSHALSARAFAVHSGHASVAGLAVPLRGWRDHDWVLIIDGPRRRYVDPTLADFGLGWDLTSAVGKASEIEPPPNEK